MITILGGGAVGLFLSSLLSKNDDVILITHSFNQSDIINSRGIYISGLTKFHTKDVLSLGFNSSKLNKVLPCSEILFICLKSYDTKNVLLKLRKYISSKAVVVTIQNGLGNKEIIKEILPKNEVVESVITFGVTKESENRVLFCGLGDIIVSDSIRKKNIFRNNFDIKIKYVKNITKHLWEKFVINCAINALATVLNIKNGELLKRQYVQSFIKQLVEETVLVAKSYDVKITKNIFNKIKSICLKTARNTNSMLQDILQYKNTTEIEFLNGKLLEMAKIKGLYLPANETIYELVKIIEKGVKFYRIIEEK
ncbi:MAG: ketopantoate reductase family protein [Endomicrobiia bacterium]